MSVPWQHLNKVLHFVCEFRESSVVNVLAFLPAYAEIANVQLLIVGFRLASPICPLVCHPR